MTGEGDVTHRSSLADALERVLDKGIVIDARLRVSVASIRLVNVEACVVVASVETYLEHADPRRARSAGPRSARRFLFSNDMFLPSSMSDEGEDGRFHGPEPSGP